MTVPFFIILSKKGFASELIATESTFARLAARMIIVPRPRRS